MGPKYEFTDETMNYDGHLLHRIRRLLDGKLGGWIEKEKNLSQYDYDCWVGNEAKVFGDANVFGHAEVYGNAKVYGNAQIHDVARIYGNAEVYGNAHIFGFASVYDNAKVYENAYVSGKAKVYGDAIIENMKIDSGIYIGKEELSKEIIQDFIYKVDDSNKLTTQTEYDSIDEFFNESVKDDIKLDTLIICSVDTKEPLIKLQKVITEDKTGFKFIVDITNEDGDDFRFRTIIKSQEHLNQLIQQTIDSLKLYPQFSKYVDDLEECL